MEFFTPGHLVVIAIVALVLFFGWKQLPDMARSVGRSLRVFKTEIKGMSQDDKDRAERAAEVPKAIAPPAPARTVPNEASAAAVAQPARTRPRPAPRPNAQAGADTRSTGGQ